MESSNVCAGIDAGKSIIKLGYSDDLGTRIIARVDNDGNSSLNDIREESEIFFDEPVFSCVVAAPESSKHELIHNANLAGFTNVNVISNYDAMALALESDSKFIVYDFGASKSDIVVLENENVIDYAVLEDVCGNEFDKIFAEYLSELYNDKEINILREAKRIKHFLSDNIKTEWHEHKIFRDDFEKLIHFTIKRAAHVANRLIRIHKPERFILTGGSANIPEVMKVFESKLNIKPEIQNDIITKGAAVKAKLISKENKRAKNNNDVSLRLKELRAGLFELEEKLTRAQKDKLYILFRNAEGINDEGIINIVSSLIQELRAIT